MDSRCSGKIIDLHVHSICSDGKKKVEDVIDIAIKNNVGVLSLTEHYNLGSYKKARKLAGDEIEIIPGVEFGTSLDCFGMSNRHVCHIGAYYPSYRIIKVFDMFETSREACVKRTLKKLNSLGIPITYREVERNARKKSSIGRFDIAITLHHMGYSDSPVSAYGDYLDQGMPGYITRDKLSPMDLIYQIRLADGVPVMFHPKSIKLNPDDSFEFISFLKTCGLEGLEVYNSHNTEEQISVFMDMATKLDLVPTVGSDYHAIGNQHIEIGRGIDNNLNISDYSIITRLKERHHDITTQNKRFKEASK